MPAAANACRRAGGRRPVGVEVGAARGSRSSRCVPARPVAELARSSPSAPRPRARPRACRPASRSQHGLEARPRRPARSRCRARARSGCASSSRALNSLTAAHQRDDHRGGDRGHGDRRLRDHDDARPCRAAAASSRGSGSCSSSACEDSSAGRQVARAEAAARARVERDHAVARAVERPVPLELRRRASRGRAG